MAMEEPTPATMAERVRSVRVNKLGISQEKLAARADLSFVTVNKVEHGGRVDIETIEKLAHALGVSPAWLAFGAVTNKYQQTGRNLRRSDRRGASPRGNAHRQRSLEAVGA